MLITKQKFNNSKQTLIQFFYLEEIKNISKQILYNRTDFPKSIIKLTSFTKVFFDNGLWNVSPNIKYLFKKYLSSLLNNKNV